MYFSERDAVAGFCSFLQDCCSCRTNSSISCNVTLVTMSSATLTPILLSKVREHNLEKDFFQHISNVLDLLTVAKKLKFNLPQDGIKTQQSSQVSVGCQKMRTVVRKYLGSFSQILLLYKTKSKLQFSFTHKSFFRYQVHLYKMLHQIVYFFTILTHQINWTSSQSKLH